ncbi:AMP-binding protein [Qaidamihabitans albus]|uniref:AMP-binding protein n=1 Tax=Qaidamihabitans albus TaxID=2795733 RepID=UPI0018F1C20C|nr:AMP-binding protein [Qaidamihabitans albus]
MPLTTSAHVDPFCRTHLPPESEWPEFLLGEPGPRYPDRLNCATALLDDVIAEHGGDRACLLAPGERAWTYDRLRATANRIAHLLTSELGVVPGNRVLLRGPNNPWLVACWFGVLKAGAVAVTTMPMLRSGELRDIHEIARIDVALSDHRFLADLGAADLGVPTLAYGGPSADDLAVRIGAHSGKFDDVPTAADDVALLAFTSGTTGRPKSTMHFHRDVLAIADTFSRHIVRPAADDVFTGTPPIAFTFGLGGLVVFPLHAGASTLLVEKATPAELARHIGDNGVSVCFTAPTAYRAMLASGEMPALSTLRRAVSAGEHLDAATWHEFRDATGIALIDGIGATEMLHIFISASDDDIRPGATGRVVPGYEARIVDEEGRPVPDGTPGRLAVRGPTGCRYLADPRQRVYVQDGWNVTGDTFTRDADGYFWYHARSDDMIVSSGYNIAGPEVEEAVLAHPDVIDCAVVGVPDPARGQLVTAFVVVREGAPAGAEAAASIQRHVKATIAPYKYPRAVEFVTELPRTATGKLQRFRLREAAATT